MTRDEILRLAREAGAKPGIENEADAAFLERFAALIEEHLTFSSIHTCNPDCTKPACVAVREAVAHEREMCAKVAEDYTDIGRGKFFDYEGHGHFIAAAIRSRT
jgi:hypothetical protein